MKLEDAPPPGWYPDPEGHPSLRYWEGSDWTVDRHVAPTESDKRSALREASAAADQAKSPRQATRSRAQQEADRLRHSDQIVSQVRTAAREELESATNLLGSELAKTLDRGRLLVAEHVGTLLRWMKLLIVLAAVLVMVWFVLEFLAQVTFMSWLGDRLDNVFDG